jgi:hypothetical protein
VRALLTHKYVEQAREKTILFLFFFIYIYIYSNKILAMNYQYTCPHDPRENTPNIKFETVMQINNTLFLKGGIR